jgi:enoyl-CoA hydratase/carnithine racemase
MDQAVAVTRHAGWALITLSREAQRNALDRAMRSAFLQAIEALAGEARVVVVTGRGASFSAGLDLKEREADKAAGRDDTAGAEWIAINLAIRRHPAVFVAAVNGLALGAGVTLVNSCDLALAASTAEIGCPELGFATYAGMAGPTLQLSQVPRKRVAWMLLAAERLDAATAERWGVINEVTAPEALLARAAAVAERIAGFDAVAIAEVKKALDHVPAVVTDWGEAMAYGQSVNAAIRQRTRAAAEALARFARDGGRPRGTD